MPITLIILIVVAIILFVIGIAVLVKIFVKQMRSEAAYHSKVTVIKFEDGYENDLTTIYTHKSKENYARQSKISIPVLNQSWKGLEAHC